MAAQNKNRYLDILQIFRGIAALMVVIHHSVASMKYYHNVNYEVLNYIGKFGKLGVDFFFILSGFIISYTVYYKYDEPESFKNYVKSRLIRVYVPYLPIGILMFILYSFFPDFSNGDREISLLTSLSLYPIGNPALSVAWTLTFELSFYLLFSISFYSRKLWNYFIVLWIVLILIFNYSSLNNLQIKRYPLFKIFFSTYNIEFILGYLLSLIIIHKIKIRLQHQLLGLLTLAALFVYPIFLSIKTTDFHSNYLFSGILFFLLYNAIIIFNKKINKNLILMHVGNASYSIYLVHNPIQMIVLRFYPKINSILTIIISLLVVLFISSLFGYLYYLIFEKKCMELIKSKITK